MAQPELQPSSEPEAGQEQEQTEQQLQRPAHAAGSAQWARKKGARRVGVRRTRRVGTAKSECQGCSPCGRRPGVLRTCVPVVSQPQPTWPPSPHPPARKQAGGRSVVGARHPRPPARHREAERRDPPPRPAARVRARPSSRWRGGAVAAGAPRHPARSARGGGPVSDARRPRAGR